MGERAFGPNIDSRGLSAAATAQRPGATFDMAYFLRTTSPPASGREAQKEKEKEKEKEEKRGGVRLGLSLFKRRRGVGGVKASSLRGFVPPEKVVQKVSRDGRFFSSLALG
jgi:hypothetical protein